MGVIGVPEKKAVIDHTHVVTFELRLDAALLQDRSPIPHIVKTVHHDELEEEIILTLTVDVDHRGTRIERGEFRPGPGILGEVGNDTEAALHALFWNLLIQPVQIHPVGRPSRRAIHDDIGPVLYPSDGLPQVLGHVVGLTGLRIAAMNVDDGGARVPGIDSRLYLLFRTFREVWIALR